MKNEEEIRNHFNMLMQMTGANYNHPNSENIDWETRQKLITEIANSVKPSNRRSEAQIDQTVIEE